MLKHTKFPYFRSSDPFPTSQNKSPICNPSVLSLTCLPSKLKLYYGYPSAISYSCPPIPVQCTSCHRELERCAEFGCILQKFKLAFFFSFLSDFVTNSTRYAPFISVFGCVDHHSNFKYFSFLLVLALSLNIRVYAADVLKFRIHPFDAFSQ